MIARMTHSVPFLPLPVADLHAPGWCGVPELPIAQYHPQSSPSRPTATARLAYDKLALHVLFSVDDTFVKATRTQYQDMVCRDSCVEIFLKPTTLGGYFNFELNCIGTMMLSYIEDPTRMGDSFARHTPIPYSWAQTVAISGVFPPRVPVEVNGPAAWRLAVTIPFALLEHFAGRIDRTASAVWQGNLFKCASEVPNPHWASWASIGSTLNFHQPDRFGEFHFAAA